MNAIGFKNEKCVEDYLCTNIKSFCEDILGDKYIKHERQSLLDNRIGRKFGGKRIDVFAECESSDYIIEIKNSRHSFDILGAIGQILNYGRAKTDSKKETQMIILSTEYDGDTWYTIQHYMLPIRFMVINRERLVEYR